MAVKKRFIAGAKCSQCQALDRVMLVVTEDDEWIECVACLHTERRPTPEDLPQIQQKNHADLQADLKAKFTEETPTVIVFKPIVPR